MLLGAGWLAASSSARSGSPSGRCSSPPALMLEGKRFWPTIAPRLAAHAPAASGGCSGSTCSPSILRGSSPGHHAAGRDHRGARPADPTRDVVRVGRVLGSPRSSPSTLSTTVPVVGDRPPLHRRADAPRRAGRRAGAARRREHRVSLLARVVRPASRSIPTPRRPGAGPREELLDPVYHEQPSLLSRLIDWMLRAARGPAHAGGARPDRDPRGRRGGRRRRRGRLPRGRAGAVSRRPAARTGACWRTTTTRTAAEIRAAADAAAAAGDWTTAVLERFRAIVRGLEERAVLDERAAAGPRTRPRWPQPRRLPALARRARRRGPRRSTTSRTATSPRPPQDDARTCASSTPASQDARASAGADVDRPHVAAPR